jgi:hypothetical protein
VSNRCDSHFSSFFVTTAEKHAMSVFGQLSAKREANARVAARHKYILHYFFS